jgi:putative ABC transport system permease protein
MEEYLSEAMGTPRLSALLLASFGTTALLLDAIGIYGVISFSVMRRTREIGLRIALGAAARDVMFMVVRQAVTLGSIGVAIGIGGALALTRLMQGMLFGVDAKDPPNVPGRIRPPDRYRHPRGISPCPTSGTDQSVRSVAK